MSCCQEPHVCPDGVKFASGAEYKKYMVARFGSPVRMAELSCTLWIEDEYEADKVYWRVMDEEPNDGELEAYATGHDPGEVFVESVMETDCDERELYAEASCRFPVYADAARTKAYFDKYIDEAVAKMRHGVKDRIDEYIARLDGFKKALATAKAGFKFDGAGIEAEEDA